ncbi:MAG: TRAP transporter small permease subunit, partial [Rhodospirillaceae bacterium]|nr:TRAP transporter small permease subunit [Rhodospirillaceae bacterium]
MPVRTYVIGKTKRVLIEPPVIACVQTVERIISRIGLVTAIIMLPLMIATRTYEIVMRKVFNAPSSVLQYVEWEAFSLLILLTLGFAYVKNSHVRVDVMRDRFGPRVRAWIEIYGFAFLALPLAGIVIVHGGE